MIMMILFDFRLMMIMLMLLQLVPEHIVLDDAEANEVLET